VVEAEKIDALIAEQQRLIALLKEKRQAVISHAVTKGLDPDVPMKDSGIEWLGEVPEHWEVKPLKYTVSSILSGTSVNAVDIPTEEGGIGVLKTSCVYDGEFAPEENKTVVPQELGRVSCPVRVNTLIVSRMNTPSLVGAAGLIREEHPGLFLPDRLWEITFAHDEPAFVHFWTKTIHYRSQVQTVCSGTSSSMQNLSQEQFRSFTLTSPPVIEQGNIVSFLNEMTGHIDELINQTAHALELLKERRAALISAAVTGKIDVRNLVEEAATS